MLRQVGHRIGSELAFSLRNIEGHVEFFERVNGLVEYAGLGELEYDTVPFFHIGKLTHRLLKRKRFYPMGTR